jgi:hypothetical protein
MARIEQKRESIEREADSHATSFQVAFLQRPVFAEPSRPRGRWKRAERGDLGRREVALGQLQMRASPTDRLCVHADLAMSNYRADHQPGVFERLNVATDPPRLRSRAVRAE